MKAVILNGSPQKRGSTTTVLRAILDELAQKGEVQWFDAYGLQMKPCIGCMKCRPNKECILPTDDAHRVRSAIASSEILVIGTPTYWGNMSAPLKMFFDRSVTLFESFETGWPSPQQIGKKAAIVVSSGSPRLFDFLSTQGGGAVRSVKKILKGGGFRIKGIIRLPNMNPQKSTSRKDLGRAVKIAEKLLAN